MKKNKLLLTSTLLMLALSSMLADDVIVDDQTAERARFGVARTTADDVKELEEKHPADLKTPSNIKQDIEYDWQNDRYLVRTKIGETQMGYTIPMTRQEYMNYTERAVRAAYFRTQNNKALEEYEGGPGLDLLDLQFSLGPAEKLFGKGGIRVKTNGSAGLSMGMKRNKIDNPTLSERARDQKNFDFKQDIQLSMNASVGSKMNFNLNYNTDASFSFDANQFKLAFDGDEDEIIQKLEAGNVNMTTGNSLISGGQSLFGIKSKLKFGHLNVTALLAKQQSSTKSVSSKGGSTKRNFEILADQYDENRHFFLAQFFRDTYDKNMSRLPLIASGVEITKIEIWVTNKKGQYDNARNILAFMDLAEADKIGNPLWRGTPEELPNNRANNLYSTLIEQYPDMREISNAAAALAPLEAQGVIGGRDFEKVESARLLSPSEYTLNSSLGYISLKQKLDDDMTLAVAFQYTKGGQTYQVGEFSTDNSKTSETLVVKLLKGAAGNPSLPMWDLMMKNIYSLGVTSVQQKDFTLQVQYMSDTVGVYTNFINEGPIAQQLLIKVMNLDRLNATQESHSDGQFDFVTGYTVNPSTGRIIFPVVEPFGSHLAQALGSEALANKYCYQELYDSTLTVAQQVAEKNKFRLKGQYVASSGAEIDLGARNVARGSVVVTAGGTTLVENSDYTVDYNLGRVTILNESIIESGTAVNVSLEDQDNYSMQRKTMMGVDLQYELSKDLTIGGTFINLQEKPLTKKVVNTDIPINNSMYGVNFKFNKDFMWLTNAVGVIPWINATAPSNLSMQGEFAKLVAGHNTQIGNAGNVYIDDFEQSETTEDISSVSQWTLASTPFDDGANALFPEAALSNNTDYGKNRALLSWYSVDRMFTSQSSNLTPGHIKNDLEQLSDHRVRQVNYDEIYPNKELTYGETGILEVLNLTFYPNQRGPYNLDSENIAPDGTLLNPEKRWGGIMRSTPVTNFENANYEYIEFWMMDPQVTFMNDANSDGYQGGDLYFNLGEVSEDVLKDGMKSFENGLDAEGDTLYTSATNWGRVSRRTSTVYAFDNTAGSRQRQDVGLNGLSSADEKLFPTYRKYVEQVSAKVNSATLAAWQSDPFSPINDPAGDDYHYYRGSDYDDAQTSIIERYKHYNGLEGNSPSSDESGERFSTAAKSTPDVEDINHDNTMNEYERYFQYHVSLRPEDLVVGQNYIESVSESSRKLRNGKTETVKWYQFRIPIREYQKKVGSIQNFKSIRFMRIFMTGWQHEQTLRFATLQMVRSDWRNYTASSLTERGYAATGRGELATSTFNIEENAGSYPVNYVLPPGIDRIVDPGQSTSTQLNEQAMVMTVTELEPHDAVAVYKNSGLDMRQYEKLQLFVHGEQFIDNDTQLGDGDLSLFVRLGSDYKDNYYEYEVPIRLTPAGTYNNNSATDRKKVWPTENMVNLDLSKLTTLKKERNSRKQQAPGEVNYTTLYTAYDDDYRENKLTVVGNPTLGEVGVIMIGVRNTGKSIKSGKVWVNELRLQGIDEGGGWAAKGNATLRVSDLATLNASGSFTSVGWGSIDQSAATRSLNQDWEYNMSGQTDLGKWLPKQLQLQAPFYYSQTKSVSTPKYDPYNDDLLFEETLETYEAERAKDSLRNLVQTVDESRSFSFNNVRFNVKSQHPMPWDPANFSFSYSQNRRNSHDPTTQYERNDTYKASANYQWTPFFEPWKPFAEKKKMQRLFTDFQLNWLPNSLSMSSNANRTYHEEQLRNVETSQTDYTLPVSFSKQFTWLRQTSIAWDLTKTLKFNFISATNARIDEPNDPVNKNLYPTEFEAWQDTISKQLLKLGTPVDYNQSFEASWSVPINKIKATDWITSNIKYKSTYEWNRGTRIDDATETGGVLQNQANWQGDVRLNLESLYNKSKFLKKVNERFKKKNTSARNIPVKKASQSADKKKGKEFKKELNLTGDTTVTLKHMLGTKRIIVTAHDQTTDRNVTLKYKRPDANTISFHVPDTQRLQLTIRTDTPLDDLRWYRAAQVGARALMMVRSVQVNYKETSNTYLPSWRNQVGDFFGQNNSGSVLSPGLGFAFGFEGGEDFTQQAIQNGWLFVNDSLTTPAVYSLTRDMTYQAVIEPIPGLKINVNGAWKHNEKQSHQFMFSDLAIQRSGSFQMTTIALGSAFGKGRSSEKYSSRAFDELLANREIIYNRMLAQYEGTSYPHGGFMTQHQQYAGTRFGGNKGESRINSSDVLVPAFIAAYMNGGSAQKVELTAFPSILKTLPNWRVSYDGLLQLFPKLTTWFKTLSLSHAYTCTYSVGNYSSYSNYAENEQGLGFTLDVANNVPVPSTAFDISTIALTESFSPLLGLNATLLSGATARAEYKNSRTVSLNMSAAQLVENISKDLTVGVGYKVADFGTKMGWANPTASSNANGKGGKVSHDLNLKLDLTHKNQTALLRKIADQYTEATSGNKAWNINFSADYQFSRMLNFKLYWQKQINTPLISSSYPTINTNFGMTLNFTLTR